MQDNPSTKSTSGVTDVVTSLLRSPIAQVQMSNPTATSNSTHSPFTIKQEVTPFLQQPQVILSNQSISSTSQPLGQTPTTTTASTTPALNSTVPFNQNPALLQNYPEKFHHQNLN
jgi:hypothetical protein